MVARRVRRLAVVVILLLVAGAVALVLATRPQLEDRRDDVDRAWTPLRAPLAARYQQLAAVNAELAAAGAGERTVARELGATLTRWERLRRSSDDDAEADAEVETADRLEGLATRVQAVILSSDRLRSVESLNQAIAAFQGTGPSLEPAATAYNSAARKYEHERNSFIRRPAADLFGYDSRQQLLLGTSTV